MNTLNFHVYIDRKPDGTPFYVGIGNDHRVKNVQRNVWHRAIRLKYPKWTRTVVETTSRKLCEELEEFLISEIGRRDLGLGPLVNLTDGGEGAPATVVSEETKRLMSLAGKGRAKSAEHKAKIAVANAGRVVSAETCAKISASKRGKPTAANSGKYTSEALRSRWKNTAYAKQMAEMSARTWENPARRKEASERMVARMMDQNLLSKMTSAVKEAWKDPALKKAASERVKGKMWVNKEGSSQRIFPTELAEHELAGWKRGRK